MGPCWLGVADEVSAGWAFRGVACTSMVHRWCTSSLCKGKLSGWLGFKRCMIVRRHLIVKSTLYQS
jgi:hypothetical protein